ncbi:MAG: hypothetical protein U1D30_12160 [Planctomycetota bacterium]
MAVKPVLQALLLADHVYIDNTTGKKVIAGTFNHLTATEFPSMFERRKHAFLSLTEVRGKASITLRYVDLSTNDVMLEIPNLDVFEKDPLQTVEVVVAIPKFPMPHPGAYAFEAHCEGELLGFLRVFVSKRAQGSPDHD